MTGLSYSSKHIKLTQSEYTRWVKPQLKSLTIDYQTLITLMNPHLKNVKENFSLFLSLSNEREDFIRSCNTPAQAECLNSVEKYIELLGKIIVLTESVELTENSKHKSTRENTLQTLEHHSNFHQNLLDLYFQFLNYRYMYKANIPVKINPKSLVKELRQSFNRFNFYILSNSDPRFFETFSDYWNGFIKPVKSILLVEKDKSHFIRRVNDLNLRWNLLHVELTKRNKKVPKSVTSLLTTMHNRWKMSLRVTLR